jgi:hypothetical protein
MSTKQPSLIARLLYKAAQKGWIRLEQNSFLNRLMILYYLFKFRLFSTLAQHSPSSLSGNMVASNRPKPLSFLHVLLSASPGALPISSQLRTFAAASESWVSLGIGRLHPKYAFYCYCLRPHLIIAC